MDEETGPVHEVPERLLLHPGGIDLLLKREEEEPTGWTAGRPRRQSG
jgi:hypothetical protein